MLWDVSFVESLSQLVPWRPHPEVWMLAVALGASYWYLVARVGRWAAPPEGRVTRSQVAAFVAAVASIWAVSDWPLHDIAEEALLSVHMIEHLVLALIVPPLMILAVPAWAWRLLLEPILPVFKMLTHPMIGLFSFNVVFAATHWPPYIAVQGTSEGVHFAAHALLMATAFLMFWPVLSPLPEAPRLPPFRRIGYLFLQTILPTIPASFLTFTNVNLYPSYPTDVRLWGIDPVTDQQAAGVIMKLAGGLILWLFIAVVFFQWVRDERRSDGQPDRQMMARDV